MSVAVGRTPMRRFYMLWLLAITLIALFAAAAQSSLEHARLSDEVDQRTGDLLAGIEAPVSAAYHAKRFSRIARTVHRLQSDPEARHLLALVICPLDPRPRRPATGFPNGEGWESVCESSHVRAALRHRRGTRWDVSTFHSSTRYIARAFPRGVMVAVSDLSSLRNLWLQSFLRSLTVYWLSGILLLTLIATQLRRWGQQHLLAFRHAIRSLIAGRIPRSVPLPPAIARDIDKLAIKIRRLSDARKARPREPSWLADLRRNMEHRELLIVANREPYIHERKGAEIEVVRPASGLVTALEPVLRHCGGLWLAHGSGSADRETADENGVVEVPPGRPRYRLKRVWLSPEEEEGYYYGFANEGLWPLCHLAHTRPTFRLSDWEHYERVNRKFLDAIPRERFNPRSIFLIQDYHFALLPKMIKRAGPRTGSSPRIGLFWHIPWPNPEAFGICPWNEPLLHGMLGSDVVGFHTQYHCNNFLETCNRYLEARIDYERFSVTMENHETLVRAFPIGIDTAPVTLLNETQVNELKAKYAIVAEKVAVGVDRLDYTKGLVERVEAVERFLEKYPQWVGRFTLAQMGSPSRTQIPSYRELARKLGETVERVNQRFFMPSRPDYRAVHLFSSHHDWDEVQYFYQLGDVCLVTSLHDGMNLVAKEYIWCQSAERGALVLSKFAGASRELTEAFIVNPYSTEEMADAIADALALSPAERELRMRIMKEKVQARSAFHWASDLIEAVIEPSTQPINLNEKPAGMKEISPAPLSARDRRDRSSSAGVLLP